MGRLQRLINNLQREEPLFFHEDIVLIGSLGADVLVHEKEKNAFGNCSTPYDRQLGTSVQGVLWLCQG